MTPTSGLGNEPFGVYKSRQAAISRRRLFPVTIFYTLFSVLMLTLASRKGHLLAGVAFFLAGVPVWTLVEYLSHRYILHGRFKQSQKPFKKFYTGLAHKYLDPLHWGHHERPYDGMHINGEIKDLLPLFAVAVPLSLIFPLYSAPLLLAGVVQSYVTEEWIHHSIHYYNFRNRYFRYVKRYHLYHHSSRGGEIGFGITSAFWDIMFDTRLPSSVRNATVGGRRTRA